MTVNSLRMVLRVYVGSQNGGRGVKCGPVSLLIGTRSAWQAVHSADTHVRLCRANILSV